MRSFTEQHDPSGAGGELTGPFICRHDIHNDSPSVKTEGGYIPSPSHFPISPRTPPRDRLSCAMAWSSYFEGFHCQVLLWERSQISLGNVPNEWDWSHLASCTTLENDFLGYASYPLLNRKWMAPASYKLLSPFVMTHFILSQGKCQFVFIPFSPRGLNWHNICVQASWM